MARGTRLVDALRVRPGEGRLVLLLAALFAALETGRGVGEVGANALVLIRLGADILPVLYVGLGAILLVLGIAYGAALGRMGRATLLSGLLAGIAALLGIESVLLLAAPTPAMAAIAWLTVAAATVAGMTISWTVATSSVDARQAKRLFPLCTAAAIGGYLVGSLAAGPLAAMAPTESLLAAEAVLFAGGSVLVPAIARSARTSAWTQTEVATRATGTVRALRVGLDEVAATPLLRLVAVAYLLFAVLAFSVSFPFFRVASETYPDEAELAAVLGGVAATVAVASLLVALLVANRFYARFGVAAAALLLPIVYVAGFGLWVVQFGFATAALVTVTQQVTQRGLSNAAWSAFYAVVPSARRAQAIAFIDGVPGQLGIILSGVLLLSAGRVLAPEQVAWLGLAAAIACTAVVLAIRRRYAGALLETLRAGAGERVLDGGPVLGDLSAAPDVRATLVAALASDDPDVRAMAAGLLARSRDGHARDALGSALDDPHPGVREAAVVAVLGRVDGVDGARGDRAEATAARQRAETVLAELLDGDEAELVVGLRAMDRLARDVPADRRAAALAAPDPAVRAMALATMPGGDHTARSALLAGLHDRAGLVRRAAAARLASLDGTEPGVLAALEAPEPDVRQAALDALHGHGPDVRDIVLPWAEQEVARALQLDATAMALAAGAASTSDPSMAFLVDVLHQRVRQHRELVLGALSVLGVPHARGVIRRALVSPDAERRAQATEAIEALADRRLGAALARLVDRAPSGGGQDRDDIVRRLADDGDRWIRCAARSVLGEPWRDDDIETANFGETPLIDRMLHLRRVPLFAGLVPEDLHRIASVARERSWPAEADVVLEGDAGDELFVIIEGRVRVVRRGADGAERVLRVYDAGDHFGELAVLRDRPRAATVVADGGPVRTLGIDGEALAAILRERPEAAMAMLATLAERIGTQ